MTMPREWRNGLRPEVADEAEHIARAFDAAAGERGKIIVVSTEHGGIDFMCRQGEVLVRDDDLPAVLTALNDPDRDVILRFQSDRVQRVIRGVVLLTLGGEHTDVLEAVPLVDQQVGRGVATPNHLLTVADGVGSACPATEPEEVYDASEPYPAVCQDNGGGGVLVYMADTGLLRDTDTHPWLSTGVDVVSQAEDYDPRSPMTGSPPSIPPYTGHGTFVAGVLRTMAPEAQILVTDAFAIAGSQLESDLVPRLDSALTLGVDIFHLTIACHSRYDLPLIAFQEWLRLLGKGTICIAAAGNSGMRRPTWPGAFPEVVAVGALERDWHSRASFSNYGPWVDVYAPGRELINAFATGVYSCQVSPYIGQQRSFFGMARWSGTSFSTPIVSGLIASRMSRTGETAKQAAAVLLAEARSEAIPGVGPVLLPRCYEECEPSCHAECSCGSRRCGCSCHG